MVILFNNNKLQKELCDDRLLRRRFGELALRIRCRLDDFQAASSLSDIGKLPQHKLHQLAGARTGQMAVSINKNYRLVFVPANDPIPKKDDGGLDWNNITAVTIIEIIDYHGD